MKDRWKTYRCITSGLFIVLLSLVLLTEAVVAAASEKKAPPTTARGDSKPVSAPQSLPLLVDVGADQCIPCKMMAPILENLKKEYAGILGVRFVDVWKHPEEADKYRVRGIPTQIFYDSSGKELGRHLGFIDKAGILKGFEQFGVTIPKPDAGQATKRSEAAWDQ